MLAKSKLNSIKTLISKALIYLYISHKEFKATVNKKEKKLKKNERKGNYKGTEEIEAMHRFKKYIIF